MANTQEHSGGSTGDRGHQVVTDGPTRPGAALERNRGHVVRAMSAETTTTMAASAYAEWSVDELRHFAEACEMEVGSKASRTAILTALAKAGIEEPGVMRRMREVQAIPVPEADDDLVRELRQTGDSEFATAVRRACCWPTCGSVAAATTGRSARS
jgi:hypothetical protein